MIKTSAIFLLTLFSSISFVQGQVVHFWPDSVLRYQLPLKDTAAKQNSRKDIYTYILNHKLIEKSSYNWDFQKSEWLKRTTFKLNYLKSEILIEKYEIENQRQEILVGRTIIKLDTITGQILEAIVYRKDRYSDKYTRTEQSFYSYDNKNLILIERFKEGTTFFKESEQKIKWTKNNIISQKVKFNELDRTITSKQKKTYSLKNDTLKTILLQDSSKQVVETKDSVTQFGKLKLKFKHQTWAQTPTGKGKPAQFISFIEALSSEKQVKITTLKQCESIQPCQDDQLSYIYCQKDRFKWSIEPEQVFLLDFLGE